MFIKTFFFVIFQSSEKGLKISSYASLRNETGLKIASLPSGDSPLKIASVSGSKEIVNLNEESSDSNSSLPRAVQVSKRN
jgi:hypothetical protein